MGNRKNTTRHIQSNRSESVRPVVSTKLLAYLAFFDATLALVLAIRIMTFGPGWRNWQTQQTQNLPGVTTLVGSTPTPGTIPVPVRKKRPSLTSATCLAEALYFESRGESQDVWEAVAAVVFNRATMEQMSICGVVYEPAQFEWTKDHPPTPSGAVWRTLLTTAQQWMGQRKELEAKYSGLTNFHDTTVTPRWAARVGCRRQIGHLIFYGCPSLLGYR